MKIRKQVYELTQEDFDQHPVWEFALDEECEEGQDEATVRPYPHDPPLDPSEGMFVVRASFTLADGTAMNGYLTPGVQGDTSMGTLQPIILAGASQVMFWCGIFPPTAEFLAESYQLLGKTAEQVFPVKFSSEAPVAGGPVEGVLEGFLYLHDEKKGLFRRRERVIRSAK
jgi:hypothetical protein